MGSNGTGTGIGTEVGRRDVLAGLGAAGALSFGAGCLSDAIGDDGDGSEDADNENVDAEDGPVVDAAETSEGPTDPDLWRDVDELRFDGYVGGWVGVTPEFIDRVENPTLVLVEGREYELTWTNRDNMHHNVAFWDADDDVVDGYSTPGTDAEGESETLTFEASAAMERYVCEYQRAIQFGEVDVLDAESER